MTRFTETYVTPLWRLLRILAVVWLTVNVLIAIAIHVRGRPGPLHKADVIIVLGSGLNRDGSAGKALTRRSTQAAALWKAGYAPVILCTGGQTPGYSQSEASACKEVLLRNGVPDASVHLEDRSRSTEENAIYSQQIMQARGWQTSVLVTDAFHMLRASWILDGHGMRHHPAPVPNDSWNVPWVAREVIALQWQAVKQLLHVSATPVPG